MKKKKYASQLCMHFAKVHSWLLCCCLLLEQVGKKAKIDHDAKQILTHPSSRHKKRMNKFGQTHFYTKPKIKYTASTNMN